MNRPLRAAASAVAAGALTLTVAPVAMAQPLPGGSVTAPVIVPRPFDIPIWQLPPLPFPFAWEFHAPPPAPAPAPKSAPAPTYGAPCSPSQLYQVYDRRLVCVYPGAKPPSWVYVTPAALNPDGTLNRDYPAN